MTSSKILFFLCISFVIGVFFESAIKIPQIFLWAFLFGAVSLIFFAVIARNEVTKQSLHYRLPRRLRAPRNDEVIIASFCIFFVVLGVLRVQISEFDIANNKLSKLNGAGQVVLTGIILAEPDIRDTSQRLKVKVADSTVLITAERYPEYKYGDKIKITGKLEAPMVNEDFNYKNYLMKDGIYSVMSFAKIELLERGHYDGIWPKSYAGILWFKSKLRASIDQNFLPPQSSILKGTILGDNSAMSNDFKTKLNITGLRHIIAVSGTHIVILCAILMSILLYLGFWRGQAFYVAVVCIALYIVLVGLPASGVRAGIMGVLYLLGQKIGRPATGSRIIFLAGTIMLFINPLLLFYDVGFQLSFLAVLGLIYIDPLIRMFFKFLAKNLFNIKVLEKHENILGVFSATFSAQIFTLPIMIYNFGNISFVSPITNILVSPIVSYLMVFGFLSAFAGVFWNALGWIISVPCYLLLSYFVWIINFFSQTWAYKVFENIHWVWIFISYFVIASSTWFLKKKFRRDFL